MKRLLAIILAALTLAFTTPQVQAQSLSDAERDVLISHLEKTRATLEAATKGLSPAQWNFKPSILRWSVAECVEHIALSEDFLFSIAKDRVMSSPALAAPKPAAEATSGDQAILKNIPDRSARFQAPEPVRPKHQTATPQELLSRFFNSRMKTIEYAKNTQGLRSHCVDSAFGKCTDAYQWLLLISAHCERHTAQLLEVKADAKFPKQ